VTTLRHIAVVRAGLAGLRAAEAVLSFDEQARVSLLGEEAVAPYRRPPLSKAVLAGSAEIGASPCVSAPSSPAGSACAWAPPSSE
jgi:NAD(P)H-nitrite reductase large subunit